MDSTKRMTSIAYEYATPAAGQQIHIRQVHRSLRAFQAHSVTKLPGSRVKGADPTSVVLYSSSKFQRGRDLTRLDFGCNLNVFE